MENPRFALAVAAAGALVGALSAGTVPISGQEEIPSLPRAPQSVCPDSNPAPLLACARERITRFIPSRTPDGTPDLSGYWGGTQVPHESLEAHPRTLDDTGGPSFVVDPPDGKVPMHPWAEAQRAENFEKYIDHNAQCFQSGVPRHLYMISLHQFIQTPTRLVMLSEETNASRIVILDGRPHIGRAVVLWQGDSRGRWEGNTLVVETTNQNGRAWLDQRGRFMTDAAVVVERFTMFEENSLLWEVTITDPLVYTRPFTMASVFRRSQRTNPELWEEACYEGEGTANDLRDIGFATYPGISSREAQIRKEAYEQAASRRGAR